jgi:hypothetical protein
MKAQQLAVAQPVLIFPNDRVARSSSELILPSASLIRRPPSTPLTPTSLAKRGRGDMGLGSLYVTPPHNQPPISGRSPFVMRSPTSGEQTIEAPSTPRRPVRRVPIVQPTANVVNAAGDGNCFYRCYITDFNIIKFIIIYVYHVFKEHWQLLYEALTTTWIILRCVYLL